MRPAKLIPPHLMAASNSSRRAHPARSRSRPLRVTVANVAPIVAVFGVIVLTVVYYVAIRRHNVQLSFKQLSDFEGHVQSAGNHSVYMVELPRRGELLLTAFSADDWGKVSERIDYVAFIYDDLDSMPAAGTWITDVANKFMTQLKPSGYGILLFPCGCIVPNIVFTRTQVRFDGYECAMLPGLVMPGESVGFVDIPVTRCKRKDTVLGFKWYETFAWKLQTAREEHGALRTFIESKGS